MANGRKRIRYFIRKNSWQKDICDKELIKGIVKSFFVVCLLSYIFYRSYKAVLFLLPLGFLYFRRWLEEKGNRKKAEFKQEFKTAIQMISANLSVGYSFENALIYTKKEMELLYKKRSRMAGELQKMIKKLELNISTEEVLKDFAKNNQVEEVQNFVTVFLSARKSGGNLIEIIGNTVYQLSEKAEVEKEIETILTAKKYEFKIMTMIPLFIILYMSLSFKAFMDPLYGTFTGIGVMTICLSIYVMAYLLGLKILKIEI